MMSKNSGVSFVSKEGAALCDVAPTILKVSRPLTVSCLPDQQVMGLEQPAEMDGTALV
jgi:hypothetical protein